MAKNGTKAVSTKKATSRIFRGCIAEYLFQSRRVWRHLPAALRHRAYGMHLHALVCAHTERTQNHSTFFLRNRPELELMRRLTNAKSQGARLDLAVLACSKGAEVYSILWTLRSARPDLKVNTKAVDISQEILDFARDGVYSLRRSGMPNGGGLRAETKEQGLVWNTYRDQGPGENVSIFERMTDAEVRAMFELEDDRARVRPWLKEGIEWLRGDAAAPELIEVLGLQDVVVANRFLCHMEPPAAESCLRNIARLVKPGGYLFASGVDLDVRTKVAKDLGWKPVLDSIREVHEGDPSLASGWPLEWWGLEPFCQNRPDWKIRYASAFQLGEASGSDNHRRVPTLQVTCG